MYMYIWQSLTFICICHTYKRDTYIYAAFSLSPKPPVPAPIYVIYTKRIKHKSIQTVCLEKERETERKGEEKREIENKSQNCKQFC